MTGCEELMTENDKRITILIEMLNATDYIVTKIAEAETVEEQQALRTKYADILAQRRAWRTEINELEESE